MKNIPVIGKFMLVMGLFGVFAVGLAVFSASKMAAIETGYGGALTHESIGALSFARASSRLNGMRAAIGDLEIANTSETNDAYQAEFSRAHADFIKFMDFAAAADPASADATVNLKQRVLDYVDAACNASIKAGANATNPAAVTAAQALYLKDCAPGFPALAAELTAGTERWQTVVASKKDALSALSAQTITLTYIIIFSGLALVMGSGFVAIRSWISKPLIALAALMGRLAGGDLTQTVTGTDRKDEVGTMSRAVQVFKDAAIEKGRLEQQAELDRHAADQVRAQTEQDRQVIADQQAAVVQSLADSLQRLSAGDLTCDMTGAFAPEYERLRTDFNAAVAGLRGVISTIITNSSAIRLSTGEISQAADDLSRRTEQQAASLEETAAALDQITTTMRKTAEGAVAAQEVVASAKTEAERGEGVVKDAVSAMNEIEKSAREIGQIIGVIDEIAFQTNLLALNAGVEAARAGDAGRGFAVVASEVRALAQRSAEAAKEIKGLIGTSTLHVGRGVTLVRETGSALVHILDRVTRINGAVTEIAASAQEQASGLAQVNTAINQMDQVTQQNAAMVEESTAASHSLAADTAELERLTARFKTGEDQAVQASKARTPASGAKVSNAIPSAKPLRVVAGNTVRKPVAHQDDWQEF